MEAIVISALGGLLVNALSGIIGNRADAAVLGTWQTICDRIKKGGKPVNHDLQQSVLRSFILALITICDDCIAELSTKKNEHASDICWLEKKRRDFDKELEAIDGAEYIEPSLVSLREIELLVLPDGSIAQDRMNAVRTKLIDAAIKDDGPSKCYKEKVERQIFDLTSLFFSDEIKTNQRVRSIFESQLLAQIDVKLQGIQLTVKRIEASLRDSALEKSLALKLGYVLAAIDCYSYAINKDIKTSTPLSTVLEMQSRRAHAIGKAIGLSIGPDANMLMRDLTTQLESKPHVVRTALRIGNIVGRVYFYSISLMAAGSLPPIDQDIELIRQAEQLLAEAELPSDLLRPVRQLWRDTLDEAHRGLTAPIDEQMEGVIGQLCKSIEVDLCYQT